jgi:hypothetical protein
MLMVVIVAVVVLLSWAVGSSVSAAWSPADVEPKRRAWRQALSSAAMVSFFLDPTRLEDVPGDGARRHDGAARVEKVIDAVDPLGSPALVPRSALAPALGAQRLRRWSVRREEGSGAASRQGGAAA